MFDLDDDSTRNNVAWFLMGDFLRPLACFVTHCESCAQDVEKCCFGD